MASKSKTINERMYRNAEGQPVLQVVMWHDRPNQITLSVYWFSKGKDHRREVLKRETYPYTKDGMTKVEFAHAAHNLALVAALALGEPDPFITGNRPMLGQIISVDHNKRSTK